MRVLLVIPPDSEIKDLKQTGSKWPRIGIAYLAAYLREHGIIVNVLDCKAEGLDYTEIEKRISLSRPNIVGLTAFTEEILEAAKVCGICKKLDANIMTVIGGPHACALPDRTLDEFGDIDVVVRGEGEQTLLELAELDGRKLDNVNGIVYRNGKKTVTTKPRELIEDIDLLPFPAWDLLPLEKYRGILTTQLREESRGSLLELPILAARGCPYKCNFCYKIYGNTLRLRRPETVVDEMEFDIKKYNAGQFYFVEGTFGINKAWGVKLCDEIIKRGIHNTTKWIGQTRVDATEELLTKMKEAGCIYVAFGVESGDPDILKNSGKGINLDQVRKAVFTAKNLGLFVECYFIIGHPNENRESIERTIRLAEELDPDLFNLGIMIPYPGTKIQEMVERDEGNYRLLSQNWSEYTKQRGGTLELKDISINELRKIQARAYLRFYSRPKRIIKVVKTIPPMKILKICVSLMKSMVTGS